MTVEHPVTLSQLCVSEHLIIGDAVGWVVTESGETEGYGFRPATVADLVSALRAEGVDFIDQWEYNHAEHCRNDYPHEGICMWPLPDALRESELLVRPDDDTEAQPFPPAGGVS